MISVVTINFNQGRFLREALDSVRAQGETGWEHIIVDPGSTDESPEIYRELEGDTRYKLILDPDHGPADGLNKGFALAKGEIFYYLNADDKVRPGAFSEAADLVGDCNDPIVLCGHGLMINEHGHEVRKLYSDWQGTRGYAMGTSVLLQQATFFTRSAFEQVGGFNIDNRICWDGELVVDMALAGVRVAIVDRLWGEFRVYSTSITGSQRFSQMLDEEHDRIFSRIVGRRRRGLDVPEEMLRRAWSLTRHPSRGARRVMYRARSTSVARSMSAALRRESADA